MLSLEEFKRDLEKTKIKHDIKIAQSKAEFWAEKEKYYRGDHSLLVAPVRYQMIHFSKSKRKQAKADLEYWERELAKLT